MAGDNPQEDFDATRTSIGAATLLKKDRLLAGRYRIVGPIGVGGMGLVYRARDERLKLDVALKVLRPERAPDKAMLERFEREIVLAREVSHPNVVRIHDIGQDGELHFISMDLVEGRSLRQLLEDDGAMEVNQAARVAADIAAGLDAAHARGVVHRDLKPANILLDADGKAYISDFGVARSLHAANLTQTGLIVGSPDYLAPEQARGDEMDGRTDIYALGLILYEMVSGKLPFRSGTLEEIIAQRSVGAPRDLSATGASVPAWMRRIIYRCLNRDPERRYQTAGELAADLRAHAAPAWRLPRLRARTAGIVAVIAIAIAAAVAIPPFLRSDGGTTLRVAVLPLANDTGDEKLAWMAGGISDLLDTHFSESAGVRIIETTRVNDTLADLRLDPGSLDDRSAAKLGELLGADKLLTGAIRPTADQLRIDTRLLDVASLRASSLAVQSTRDEPLALVGRLAGEIRTALSLKPALEQPIELSSSVEAVAAYTQGRAALGRGDTNTATPLLETAVAADPGFGVAWLQLAHSYDLAGRSDAASDAAQRVIELSGATPSRVGLQARALASGLEGDFAASRLLLQELIERFPSDTPARLALAEAYGDEGRFDDASDILRRVVAEDPNHPRAWFLLGKYAIQSGDSRRAISEYLVRDLVVQNRLDNPQGKANVLNAMGIAYQRIGKTDDARENYEAAAQLRREIGDARGTATSLNNLARLEMMAGNFEAAREDLERAKQVSIELGDRAGLAAFINTIGSLEEELGDYASALEQYRAALKIREELGDRRALTESYNNVGFAYYTLGELDNARIYWERALDEARELGNRDGEMQVLQSLGLMYTARGEWDRGTKAFLEALTISRELDYPNAEAVSLGYLGQIAAIQGRYDAALSQLDEALEILAPVGDTRGLTEFGLQRARVFAELGLPEQVSAQLDKVESMLEEAPNREYQSEYLRLRALSGADSPARTEALLDEATAAASASGSAAALLRARLAKASIALGNGDLEAASEIATDIAVKAGNNGFAPLVLEALEISTQALVAQAGPGAAYPQVSNMLDLLDELRPHGSAYRIRAFATDVLVAHGDDEAAVRQQRLATEEVGRIRNNLPEVAMAVFNVRPDVIKLDEEALVDGN